MPSMAKITSPKRAPKNLKGMEATPKAKKRSPDEAWPYPGTGVGFTANAYFTISELKAFNFATMKMNPGG